MPSKTSYFNTTLLRYNVLRRNWPIWACYLLALTLFIALPFGDFLRGIKHYNMELSSMDSYYVSPAATNTLAMLMGLFCALVVFSYLNTPRSANFFHSLPLRREGLFISQYLSGLMMMLGPVVLIWLVQVIMAGVSGIREPIVYGYLASWLGRTVTANLFFFSFAVLCSMFTGHTIATIVIYGVFNAYYPVMKLLLTELFSQAIYGFVEPELNWDFLCPLQYLSSSTATSPFIVYALVALLFAALALLLYRRRAVETAGDVIAVPWLKPVFCYGFAASFTILMTFLASTIYSNGYYRFGSNYSPAYFAPMLFFLIFFGLIGYIAAQMMLQKSFKIFRTGWKGGLAFSIVLLALMLGVRFDVLGIEKRVPTPQEVEAAYVQDDSEYGRYYGGDGFASIAMGSMNVSRSSNHYLVRDMPAGRLDPITGDVARKAREIAEDVFTETDNIRLVTDLHRYMLQLRPYSAEWVSDDQRRMGVTIAYLLRDGSVIQRRYDVFVPSDIVESSPMEALKNTPEALRKRYFFPDIVPNSVFSAELFTQLDDYYSGKTSNGTIVEHTKPAPIMLDLTPAELQALFAAVQKDIDLGTLGRYHPNLPAKYMDEYYEISLRLSYQTDNALLREIYQQERFRVEEEWAELVVPLNKNAANTMAILSKLTLPEGYLRTYSEIPELSLSEVDLGRFMQNGGKNYVTRDRSSLY